MGEGKGLGKGAAATAAAGGPAGVLVWGARGGGVCHPRAVSRRRRESRVWNYFPADYNSHVMLCYFSLSVW